MLIKTNAQFDAVTVTLNPAIDLTLTVPDFEIGSVNRAKTALTNAGGKGVNVALVLADYGMRVAATGLLGSENYELFENLFKRRGIANEFVKIPGATRVGIKIVDPTTGQTTDINLPGQDTLGRDLDILGGKLETINADWVVLAGSLPPGVPGTIYRDLVTILKHHGHHVALDTSREPLRLALCAGADVVKPNLDELRDILGETIETPSEIVDAARSLIEFGTKLAVVSLGAEGAWFVTREEAILATPPVVEVASTVGAGDAMVAGIVAAHIEGLNLDECARLATAFSLEAVTRVGSGLASRAHTGRLIEDVRLHRFGKTIFR